MSDRSTPVATPGSTEATPARSGSAVDAASIAIVVLSSVQPFARYLNVNADEMLRFGLVALDALLWTGLVLAVFVAIRLAVRRGPAVAVAVGIAVFNLAFWNFFRWFPYEPESVARMWTALLIWGAGTAVAVRLATIVARFRYVPTFVIVFLAVWTGSLLAGAVQMGQARTNTAQPEPGHDVSATFVERPNVYFFLLDGHARSDQLQAITGSDNRWFGEQLADRGFSVSESSTSAYLQTHLSLTSTLDMDYVWTPGVEYRSEYELAEPAFEGDNQVVRAFEANGYRYVGAPDGKMEWSVCPAPGPGRTCIEPVGGPFALREPHTFLVLATPVGSLGLPVTHNDLASIRDGIREVRRDEQPFFLYAHVLSPHFPFRYQPDCTYRQPWKDGYNDTPEQFVANYATDVQCLDREMVATIDEIVADDPGAVIIVQSDHGSNLRYHEGLRLDDASPEQLHERFSALDAMRLPGGCRGSSIDGEPLVNTFRILFACLSGTEPELLEARHFYPDPPEQETGRSFVEVDLEGNRVP